jgi:hypothetical protein
VLRRFVVTQLVAAALLAMSSIACDHKPPAAFVAPTPLSTEVTGLSVDERKPCVTLPDGATGCVTLVLLVNGVRVHYDLEAYARFADGHVENVTPVAMWTSSDTTIADVAYGAVTVRQAGVVEIRAEYRGLTASFRIVN